MPKLLIADGSPMMHRIMELTFAPEGVQVLTASDGEQAISLLSIARPDVVIADHALSRRSGYEVAAFIREHGELGHIPILLLASPFEPLDRDRAEAAGVAGEISKPFDPGQLVARVRELLTRRQPPPVSLGPLTDRDPAPALKLVTPATPPARGALDDYFDRLDAALAKLDDQLTEPPESPAPSGAPGERLDPRPAIERQREIDDEPLVPTLDALLATPPASPAGRGARSPFDGVSSGAPLEHPRRTDADGEQRVGDGDELGSIVEALEVLRSRNSGQHAPSGGAAEIQPAALDVISEARHPDVAGTTITEAMVDEITRRVLERLAPGAVSQVVNEVVTQVAERLLREEIARLK